MLIMRDIPREEIKNLKKGGNFLGSAIVTFHRTGTLISLATQDGNAYTIHLKQTTCRVFKKPQKRAAGEDTL
jgi:hypothetical protein